MPILNYTTTVPAEKTIGEITTILVRKGARTIASNFRPDGSIEGVTFTMAVGGLPVRFQLPSNAAGVVAVMLKEKPYNAQHHGYGLEKEKQYKAKFVAQAERVAWRILKDWVEAQLALIEAGQAEMAQVFMPYALNDQGQTMYELFVENNQRRLAASSEASR